MYTELCSVVMVIEVCSKVCIVCCRQTRFQSMEQSMISALRRRATDSGLTG